MRGKPFIARPAGRWSGKKADSELGLECIDKFETPDGISVNVMEPSALGNLVMRYRDLLFNVHSCPSLDDVRETLKRLAGMRRIEAASHWRGLDAAVKVEIDRAGWHGLGVEYVRQRSIISAPDALPELAGVALKAMERQAAGRRRTKELAKMFACELAVHWHKTTREKPRVQVDNNYRQTDFQLWAADLFMRAGFSVGDINKTLQSAIRAMKQSGCIPR